MLTGRRLADTRRICPLRKASGFCDGDEYLKLFDVHGTPYRCKRHIIGTIWKQRISSAAVTSPGPSQPKVFSAGTAARHFSMMNT
jgi:hypothetical protein